jgi:hypothetical protein
MILPMFGKSQRIKDQELEGDDAISLGNLEILFAGRQWVVSFSSSTKNPTTDMPCGVFGVFNRRLSSLA